MLPLGASSWNRWLPVRNTPPHDRQFQAVRVAATTVSVQHAKNSRQYRYHVISILLIVPGFPGHRCLSSHREYHGWLKGSRWDSSVSFPRTHRGSSLANERKGSRSRSADAILKLDIGSSATKSPAASQARRPVPRAIGDRPWLRANSRRSVDHPRSP